MFRFIILNSRWLAAGALLTLMSSFGQTYFISIFAGEIRAEFNLSHGDWGAIYGFGTFASAIAMVWAGGLTDIMRVRRLGPIVLAALAASCLFMAFNPWVALLPVVIFCLRFTGQGMSTHIAAVAMSRWVFYWRGYLPTVSGSLDAVFRMARYLGLCSSYSTPVHSCTNVASARRAQPTIYGLREPILRNEWSPLDQKSNADAPFILVYDASVFRTIGFQYRILLPSGTFC